MHTLCTTKGLSLKSSVSRSPHAKTTKVLRTATRPPTEPNPSCSVPSGAAASAMRQAVRALTMTAAVCLASMNNGSKAAAFAARVLVTGGAGYIGSHTCVELIKAGEKVSRL